MRWGGGLLSCVYYYKTINISAEEGESSSLTVEPDSSSKLDDSTDSSISADKWRITSAKGTSPLNLTLTSGILYGSVNNATYTGKGVASFDIDDFLVSNGAVSIDYSGGQTANENDDGYLSASDWSNFNNKQSTLTFGDLTAASAKLSLVGTGTNALIGSGLSLDINESNLTHNNIGGLTSGDSHTQYLLLAGRIGGQTVSNSLGITGTTDVPQLKITANSTQTNPLIIVYRSNGTTEALRIHSDHATTLFIGSGAGQANTPIGTCGEFQYTDCEGLYNNFIGTNAGYSNTTGDRNTALGWQAFYTNTSGSYNTALGYTSLKANTEGTRNTAVGMESLRFNTSGSWNTAVGMDTLEYNTIGSYNSAIGFNALELNTEGNSNIAMGVRALFINTTGSGNTAIGTDSLRSNETGSNNVAIGGEALRTNIASSNTAVGSSSLRSNTEGTYNAALGVNALYSNSTGGHNTGIGMYALQYNTSGYYNTVVGSTAGQGVSGQTLIYGNSLFGYQAGKGLLTGANYNTLIGYKSGDNITTGAANIVIGYDIDSPTATNSYTLNIGNMVFGTGLNGTGTTIPAGGNIGIGTSSPNFRFDVSGGSIRIEGTDRLYFGGTEAGDTAGNIYHDGTDFVISDTIKPTGYLSSDGTAGATSTVTVKGSDGANCTLTYKNGLYTATTCP